MGQKLAEWAGAGKTRASGIFRGGSLPVAAQCIQKIIHLPSNGVTRLPDNERPPEIVFLKSLDSLNTVYQNQP
jgi:hypothetical protein